MREEFRHGQGAAKCPGNVSEVNGNGHADADRWVAAMQENLYIFEEVWYTPKHLNGVPANGV